jgi:cytochrome c1
MRIATASGFNNTKRQVMKLSKICVTALALFAATTLLSAADAKENYEKSCQKCHGADGKGQTPMGKKTGAHDWTSADVQAKYTDEKMTKAIKEGVKEGDTTKMKGYEDLSDAEVKALVTYIRAFKK